MPPIWVQLRNFLDADGAGMSQHSSRLVIITLTHGLYDEEKDLDVSLETTQIIIESSSLLRYYLRNTDAPYPSHITTGNDSDNVQVHQGHQWYVLISHNIWMRWKDADKNFSGDIGEFWMDYVNNYFQVSADYVLGPQHKFQYLHNILSKDSRRLYLEIVSTQAQSFQQMFYMVNQD